ncbi:MAG: hypothetical protein NTX25_16920 [Proteobacteria bacterium]|nr:hypothetical protein [Pseudomonadota bacterium]
MNRRPNSNNSKPGQNSPSNSDRSRPRRRKRSGGNGPGHTGGPDRPQRTELIQQVHTENQSRRIQPVLKRYAVIFYETHAQAREDAANLEQKKAAVDQVNIVIRAEGSMEDPELLKYGKVYAGEAWHLIHTRRVDEGWYNEVHE